MSPAACSYITGRPSAAAAADQDLVRGAIANLARSGLVTIDPGSAARSLRMPGWASLTYTRPATLANFDGETALLSAGLCRRMRWLTWPLFACLEALARNLLMMLAAVRRLKNGLAQQDAVPVPIL